MDFKKILSAFLIWRLLLFIIAFIATFIIQFGNRFPYKDKALEVTNLPSWIWGFGNFDGVHYLRIAQNGYSAVYSQAFFPLYPLLINLFGFLIKPLVVNNLDISVYVNPAFFYSGLFLSNIFFALGIYFFYKLIRIDFSKSTSFNSIILLLILPTAFYFGSVYSESLFFLLCVLSFYFMRKQKFFTASLFAFLASLTKLLGAILVFCLIIELAMSIKGKKITSIKILKLLPALFIAPLGLIFYMIYLKINFNNPIFFLTSQPFFGAERSSQNIILLPQVIFRYLKILTTLNISSLAFFNAFIELSSTITALVLVLLSLKRIRLSYIIFSLSCLIIPTLTGTLSSMPRYALMIFLIIPWIAERFEAQLKVIYFLLFVIEIIFLSLFVRGYWIA